RYTPRDIIKFRLNTTDTKHLTALQINMRQCDEDMYCILEEAEQDIRESHRHQLLVKRLQEELSISFEEINNGVIISKALINMAGI
ncbi:hypothetical protein NF27_BN00010, partial [Candidatus Jidaibacter acanthamoeba]